MVRVSNSKPDRIHLTLQTLGLELVARVLGPDDLFLSHGLAPVILWIPLPNVNRQPLD
jgi:hypothetical protein